MSKESNDIWTRRHELEKARRDQIKLMMIEYDKKHYEAIRELREDCEKLTNHNWRFTDFGPVGHAWYHCTYCGKSKVEDP